MALETVPSPVRIYALLGLIPFLLPPAIAWARPQFAQPMLAMEADYAALILSFLGGVRWAMEARRATPDAHVIGQSMLPTLAALALMLIPAVSSRLFGLAIALAAQWAWDRRSKDAPPWFSRLRTVLSAGALVGLVAGGIILV
jgi:hypothetical protein